MKKFNFAMLSAIALTGAMTFTACSSDDETANVNPTYDGKAVKTSFTLSINDVKATRMSKESVQEASVSFQGMEDIYLFPAKATITATTDVTEGYINLPAFNAFDAAVLDAQGKIYNDVSFSIGVSDFLFYGANMQKDNGELKPSYLVQDKATFGGTADWAATPLLTNSKIGSITFDLVPYQKDKNLDFVKTEGANTIKPLNEMEALLTTAITNATAANTTDDTTTPLSIVEDLQELQKTIRNDVSQTATPDYKEYAGSSASMVYLFTKLYNALKNMEPSLTSTEATPTNYAAPLIAKVEEYFTASGDATSGYTVAWTTDPDFPGSLNLPDGAVAIKFNGTDAFEYVDYNVDGLIATSVGLYTHPARLYYTINTKGMIKDAEYLNTLANSQPTWDAVKTSGSYTEAAINATTHSVILKDQVQFAVGRLDVQARVQDAVVLKDNGSGIAGDVYYNPQPVVVPAAGYPLTGVLIGGQKQVGWDFTPVATADQQTIYDNSMTEAINAKQGTAYSAINHTLALETEDATAINIALEFENNSGKDFYGMNHNIIPNGSKFYLIAKLTPGTNEINNPAGLTQVFKQDYTTIAKLTIGETSLQKAYNVIPDLRSPKLEFGLSVDLEWKEGITFEQTF